VDSSVFTDSSLTGFGGLIRDHRGSFLYDFYGSIDPSCITHAEVLTLYHGLDLCWSYGHRHVVCYSYSLHVIQLIRDPLNVFHMFGNLIGLIKKLLSQD